MPKNKKKNDKKELEKQDFYKFLEENKNMKDMNEEELAAFMQLVDNIFEKKFSIRSKILEKIKTFLIKYFIFYIISIFTLGFIISYVSLTNLYYVFFVAMGVSFGLTIFEMAGISLGKSILSHIIFFIIFIIDCCLFNTIIEVFSFSSMWLIYIVMIEFFYLLFNISRVLRFKRKISI